VVYLPDAASAAIAGSFNDWQSLPMLRAGTEGYWEISLDLKPGEYRYSFILDGGRRVADPTVRVREQDDFGTENSVLEVRV
jgi:1,4-alpha-glucan branching enzyme